MKKKILIIIIILIIVIATFIGLNFNKREKIDEWIYNNLLFSSSNSGTSSGTMSLESISSSSFTASASDSSRAVSSINKNLGFAVGGSKDIKNFRENVNNGYFPISTDITYNGIFYDYSFDTGNAESNTKDLFYPSYSTAISKDVFSGKNEYYMSVGLNSNIKQSDFKRPKLNLVVVLDNSGSMSSSFDSYYYDGNTSLFETYKTKMQIANNSINILLDHLNQDDRFGMVIFNSSGQIAKNLSELEDTDIKSLKKHIAEINATGGTNFEDGYKKALSVFESFGENDETYENRIIVLTDAMPNMGNYSTNSLMNMVENSSKNKIYTTFIGIGVDFNTELIEKIGTVEGANYYSVHNEEEFEAQMGKDFDYMVTPLVFDLNLDFLSNDFEVASVYGTDIENNKNGNIIHVNTLFPSARNDNDEVKGGIILLKLNKNNLTDNGEVTLKVSYRDSKNEYHQNEQNITFIENDKEFYDNTGIRKAIVLTRYVNILKDWILYERANKNKQYLIDDTSGILEYNYTENDIYSVLGEHERASVNLTVSEEYKEILEEFKTHFESEIKEIKDNSLKQEIKVIDKLIDAPKPLTKIWNTLWDL